MSQEPGHKMPDLHESLAICRDADSGSFEIGPEGRVRWSDGKMRGVTVACAFPAMIPKPIDGNAKAIAFYLTHGVAILEELIEMRGRVAAEKPAEVS